MRAKCYLKEKFFFQPSRIRFHTINFIISKYKSYLTSAPRPPQKSLIFCLAKGKKPIMAHVFPLLRGYF